MTNALDKKLSEHYAGYVVKKDLSGLVKGNALVPSFVLEYLLGQYCASDDPQTIQAGVEQVKSILEKHCVTKSESELWKASIKEAGSLRIIDKVQVILNDKLDQYEASFSNLTLSKVPISSELVKANPKLLVAGIWCLVDVEYVNVGEGEARIPWVIDNLKAIQTATFNTEEFLEARRQFTVDEWLNVMVQSLGFEPEQFTWRQKMHQIARLVPFVERNYNLVELGPKGTGKSHIFSEFSPDAMLVSGGEITVAKLFVNNSSGKLGLVAYWNVVAFDEFAGRKKTSPKALVDIMKNYMANKTFSRGVESHSAEASVVFVGNTDQTVPHMLKTEHLFAALPATYVDSAFLDRIHNYLPGWESDPLRKNMFTSGYGFVVDYFAAVLKSMRGNEASSLIKEHFRLSDSINNRDEDGIRKTFSGLFKILFPHGEATVDEIESLLVYAIEGRKRVKDQLLRIDPTFPPVDFWFEDNRNGERKEVFCEEERLFPVEYAMRPDLEVASGSDQAINKIDVDDFKEWLVGSATIHLRDAGLSVASRVLQLKGFFEYLAGGDVAPGCEVMVSTKMQDEDALQEEQVQALDELVGYCSGIDISLNYQFDKELPPSPEISRDGAETILFNVRQDFYA